jgi:hypothetical protein
MKKYDEEEKLFDNNKNMDTSNLKISKLIEKNGIDIFLILSINKIISNLGSKGYDSKDTYKKFSNYCKVLFNENPDLKLTKELCQLLNLYYDEKKYKEIILPKLPRDKKGLIDKKIFEMLLYGFRFCINSLDNPKNKKKDNYLFQALLSENFKNIIKKSLIPGNDIKEDLHISTLEVIKTHLDSYQEACGCYVCSCGYYYNIDPCGFPTTNRTFNCPVCEQKCGWAPKKVPGGAPNHGMVIREGHYRIFKNKDAQKKQMNRWKDPPANIPSLTFDEYMKKVIQPLENKVDFGFNDVSRDYFESQNKKVRELSTIGYRLLNFISYSHLFFAYLLKFIPEEEMEKYLIKNTNIIKILEIDWDKLIESLNKENIGDIQIFMNIIFKELSKMIKNCQILTTEDARKNFEKSVNELVEKCIKNYPKFSENYRKENENKSQINHQSLKGIITQLKPSEVQNQDLSKYFILTKYKTEEDMMRRIENKEKYPLLNQMIAQNPSVKKLKNLIPFNEFANFMVENYSFKISREEAKNNLLINEPIFNNKDNKDNNKDNNVTNKYNNFIKAWDEIKSEAIKYICRPEMPVKNLKKDEKLICFLIDEGELYNGMYLASACQNFIEWQNSFLQPIVDANEFNGILHHYVDNIKRKTTVYEAKVDQIVLIQDRFKKYNKSQYMNFNDVIYSFSERNIFNENGTINYSNYNTFTYDFPSIEEELGKILLPGVCMFESEKNLNFVTFWGEGFKGGKSEMIINLNLKYKQKQLEEDERKIITRYINKMNKEKMAKYNMNYNFKDLFGSLQILMFYLTEKSIMKEDEKISNVIKKAPKYLKLSDDCREFFLKEGVNFNLTKIINIFLYFEHLCYEDLAKTLPDEYKVDIPEETKNAIRKKLLAKELDSKIKINDLAAATRRYISRYLVGKLQFSEIQEDRELAFDLTREELWDLELAKLDDLMDIVTNLLFEFKLQVRHAYALYNLIGDKDKNSINTNTNK